MVIGHWSLAKIKDPRPKSQRPTTEVHDRPDAETCHIIALEPSCSTFGTPLYRWFYDELRSAILEGRIAPGARLPATRDLAREYKLARATVVAAFEQLKSEGYVEGRVGAGTYVSQVLPDDLLQVGRTQRGKDRGAPARGMVVLRPASAACTPAADRAPRARFAPTRLRSMSFLPRCGPRSSPGDCAAPRPNCCPAARRWDTVRCARRLLHI